MNRLRPRRALLLLAGMIALSGCHAITGQSSVSGEVRVENENARIEVAFGDDERRLIRDYFASDKGLPPGLAKKQKLPPGLARQVQKNGTLPPGLEGRRLPGELERQLSPLPESYVRLRVGLDVVLMNRDTRVIVDIVEDIGDG